MSTRNPFLKYVEGRTEDPELTVNEAGFVEFSQVDWPVIGYSDVARMLTKISGQVNMCHPGQPDLFTDLIPEVSRLGRILPERTTQADVYRLLQDVTGLVLAMVAEWKRAERYVAPSVPVRSARAHRPQRRKAKQPSAIVDTMQKRVDAEFRDEIREALDELQGA